MGYTLSKAPDSERYTRLEQRKRMRVLDVEEDSDHEEMEGVVSETGVACQASVVVVDGECQTCSDFMDEHKQTKDELMLFKAANQHLQDEVTMLRQCVGHFLLISSKTMKRS